MTQSLSSIFGSHALLPVKPDGTAAVVMPDGFAAMMNAMDGGAVVAAVALEAVTEPASGGSTGLSTEPGQAASQPADLAADEDEPTIVVLAMPLVQHPIQVMLAKLSMPETIPDQQLSGLSQQITGTKDPVTPGSTQHQPSIAVPETSAPPLSDPTQLADRQLTLPPLSVPLAEGLPRHSFTDLPESVSEQSTGNDPVLAAKPMFVLAAPAPPTFAQTPLLTPETAQLPTADHRLNLQDVIVQTADNPARMVVRPATDPAIPRGGAVSAIELAIRTNTGEPIADIAANDVAVEQDLRVTDGLPAVPRIIANVELPNVQARQITAADSTANAALPATVDTGAFDTYGSKTRADPINQDGPPLPATAFSSQELSSIANQSQPAAAMTGMATSVLPVSTAPSPIDPEVSHTLYPIPVAPSDVPRLLASIALDRPAQTIDLRLDPVELGSVSFAMDNTPTGLTITITAERPETIDLMRRHADQFLADLRQAGFANPSLNFGQSSGGQEYRNPGQDRPAPTTGLPLPTAHEPFASPARPVAQTGLDLRL